MNYREVLVSEAGEHLLGVFRALLGLPKFQEFVDKNFVIRQYYDSTDGKILRVEIKDRNEDEDPTSEPTSYH
jgi:hypothetical protein